MPVAIQFRMQEITRIVCIGGGLAALYFALLLKRLHPQHAWWT